jgi:hypothetical protein
MEVADFARSYEIKTDDELLRLALDPEQLTPEGVAALSNELARRQIGSADKLSSFRESERQRKEEEAKKPGRLFFYWRLGVGRLRLGRAERIHDPLTGMEQFKTTVFVMLFWFPLIPTGTYRVEMARATLFGRRMTVLEKLPLDWEQVLKVWVVVAALLLALILVLKRAR